MPVSMEPAVSILPVAFVLALTPAVADATASYPANWREWTLVKETVIPGRDTPIPDGLPPLFVDTIKTYNWINDGKGSTLRIYVNPTALEAYATHGPYTDGPTVVGVYNDVGIVFVTEFLMGEPLYGTYDFAGKDVTGQHPSFAAEVCSRCHQGYAEVCKGGTCAVPADPPPSAVSLPPATPAPSAPAR